MKNRKLNSDIRHCLLIAMVACIICPLSSCKKYLEAKSDQSITTPSTIDDLEGLMNAYSVINADYPSAPEVMADNFYLLNTDYLSLSQRQRDIYSWTKSADVGGDYTAPYQAIAYTNIVLDALPKVTANGQARKDAVKGEALFTRASYHFALAQLFAAAYDQASAGTDLGIALRLTADIESKAPRASMAETYASITGDLQQALTLLPDMPAAKYLPGRAAAYGMLSRVYLAMRDYPKAGACADSCLTLYHTLLDYNTVAVSATAPFQQFNAEVIYDARSSPPSSLTQSRAKIDTALYRSYNGNDLRKTAYFKANADGTQAYKGSYTGLTNGALFTGIATDEILLTKAECAARAGKNADALLALNTLLEQRWKKGTFIPYTTTDNGQLLSIILQERRKELLFRGVRLMDLKRLNKEPDYAQVIYRKLGGTLLTLEPNSPRYLLQIDQNAVNIGGLVQNP
ncbi:RagB/SusD family nutrient uptake outer membrane protein [Mucilaginibacter segetis]|uniref:RagB/SusD family nutrient uptake outer membrane protein n=1 Tax=Mucilaginibacter segetis TaxID=2793071 RepID=A0A934PT34_9SPHI|nr:RagB/SusD family nutrient uptake outer membrane protein [Mucilaginibacter segetis]MBK0378545.1 RagB/SusD family nutrient uptake outer membrane protein [Mucilaginibacter segetis]